MVKAKDSRKNSWEVCKNYGRCFSWFGNLIFDDVQFELLTDISTSGEKKKRNSDLIELRATIQIKLILFCRALYPK